MQRGDSWWSISDHFQVDWNSLAADNRMTLGSTLHPGMVLVIPGSHAAPHPAAKTNPWGSSPSSPASSESSSERAASAPSGSDSASSGTVSSSGESGFEACVISRESGGNPDASNGSHWGLFQFSESTWSSYGGNPADWGSASAAEQQQVFANAVAQGGESNWAPYDGC